MSEKSQRRPRLVVGSLAVAGVVLLIAWMYSVTAYGFEVDARGLVAELQARHTALFAGGAAMLVTAASFSVLQRRNARHSGQQ